VTGVEGSAGEFGAEVFVSSGLSSVFRDLFFLDFPAIAKSV
jgi:hypothetical protein